MATTENLGALPYFAKSRDGMPDFWAVSGTGRYELDCALGRQLGQAAIAEIRRSEWQFHLGYIVSDMIERGDEEAMGVVIGFCEAITLELIRCRPGQRARG